VSNPPDVFAYLDYRTFLRDWFDARKAANPRFSHRLFARLAGHRSPSQLLLVIQGKRNLTAESTDAYCRAMGLGLADAAFFRALVHLDQAKTNAERNDAWQQISASRRFLRARSIEGRGFEALSTWYMPAVRELAQRPDFRPDPAWIARAVRPRIKPSEAKRALTVLLELGLLVRDGDDVVVGDATYATPHEVAGLAVHNYHRGMLERAIDSIDGSEPEERHLCAVTAAVPESLLPRLKEELDRVQERLLDLCDGALEAAAGERVVQLSLAMFPLSEPLPKEPS
jgi:uncharacterized protein (TIGR02147 family)